MKRYKVTAADFLNTVARASEFVFGWKEDHPTIKRLEAMSAVLGEPVSIKDVPVEFSDEVANVWLAGYRACQERMNRGT